MASKKVPSVFDQKRTQSYWINPQIGKISLQDNEAHKVKYNFSVSQCSNSHFDSSTTSPKALQQIHLSPTSIGQSGVTSMFTSPDKDQQVQYSQPRIVFKSHGNSMHQMQKLLSETPQQQKKKKMVEDVIQMKQRQMFLDSQRQSMSTASSYLPQSRRGSSLNRRRQVSVQQQTINTQNIPQSSQPQPPQQLNHHHQHSLSQPLHLQQQHQHKQQQLQHLQQNKMSEEIKKENLPTGGGSFLKSSSCTAILNEGENQKQASSNLHEGISNIVDETLARLERQKSKKKEESFDDIIRSSIDSQLKSNQIAVWDLFQLISILQLRALMLDFRYKNPKVVDIERKGEVQTYIYDKKLQNKLKYSDKSKVNMTALPVPKGSISVMLNVAKKEYGFNLNSFNKKIPAKSKFKMKWKTIQWLLQSKQSVIKQLFSNYSIMLKFAKNKKEGMDREEFGDLLSQVGLGAEKALGDRLFFIFDDDNSGTVDYKELIIGLEMFKENSIDDKLKMFMELCDTDKNGNISPEELYSILKQNLFTHDDKVRLKRIVKQIFQDCDLNKDGVLDKEELIQATTQNPLLLALLNESVKNVKRVDQLIESDLEEPLHCWVPISSNLQISYYLFFDFKSCLKYQCQLQRRDPFWICRKASEGC